MSNINLSQEIKQIRSEIMESEVRFNHLTSEYNKNVVIMDELKNSIATLDRVAILLQKTAEHQRAYISNQIETIGTTALQYIYGAGYSLELEMKPDKKKPECEVWVNETMTDGSVIRKKPQDSKGGGVTDIVSIALRFAVLQVFNSPEIDGPVLLDEPGKHVSKEFAPLLSDFLTTLSEQLGRQQIVITHNEFMAESSGAKFMVRRHNDMSVVERVE